MGSAPVSCHSPSASSSTPPAGHVQYSVTITTSALPLSSFSGSFILTLHPTQGQPVSYDYPYGRFLRGSAVRFHIAVPGDFIISQVSIQAGYLIGVAKWRINSIRLLSHTPVTRELGSGPYTVPGFARPPSSIPLRPIPIQANSHAGGSAILHIWLPSWNRALRQPTPVHTREHEMSCISSISSSATLVESDQDPRGWTIDQWLKSPPDQMIEHQSAKATPPSTPLAPVLLSSPRYASWGHASLSVFPTSSPSSILPSSYISVWPAELSPSIPLPRFFHHIRKLHCKSTWSPSLEKDILEEDGPPDIELHILGVNAEKLQRWAESERKRARGYTPLSWNCAEVVWKAIRVGLEDGACQREGILGTDDGREGDSGQKRQSWLQSPSSKTRSKVKRWEMEPFVRELTTRRPEKIVEGFPGRIAEWTGTKVPADLEVIVDRMRVDGYCM